jgi:hypothetical protein
LNGGASDQRRNSIPAKEHFLLRRDFLSPYGSSDANVGKVAEASALAASARLSEGSDRATTVGPPVPAQNELKPAQKTTKLYHY